MEKGVPDLEKEGTLWQRLTREADIHAQPLPGCPIVELSGRGRVLIENHRGMAEYSSQRIGVKVRFGRVVVCGRGLEVRRMTREQLVILGEVASVTLEGRG